MACEGGHNSEDEGAVMTRIFVGGLGGSVTADDVRKTFSSLGTVKDIDIVRTKGRSFAYMDFLPFSSNALSKLFSMYNGCVWKGGRLKLEKAKEHYINRLRREWAEGTTLASTATNNNIEAGKNMCSGNLKKLWSAEKKEIHIFFPKLKKVKSLPLSGTGKHKYSFQRIEVPPLPIHFCDSEEHSDPFHTANWKHLHDFEKQSGGMNEVEFKMMESVMKKLFDEGNNSKDASNRTELAKENNSMRPTDDALLNEDEADDGMEDNLIVNMVSGGNTRFPLLRGWEQETTLVNQESTFTGLHTSKDMAPDNIQKRKVASLVKKRKSILTEESDVNEIVSPVPEKKGRFNSGEPESAIQQTRLSHSRTQKFSWRKLVENGDSNQFSISHVLPSIVSAEEEQHKSVGSDVLDSNVYRASNAAMCKIKAAKNKHNVQKTLVATSNKKNKSLPAEESDVNEIPSQISEKKDSFQSAEPESTYQKSVVGLSRSRKTSGRELVENENNSQFGISPVLPSIASTGKEQHKSVGPDVTESETPNAATHESLEDQSKDPVGLAETVSMKPNDAVNKSARGAFWLQKSSWTQLVGGTCSSSFSICQILPGNSFGKDELPKPSGINDRDFTAMQKHGDLKQNRSESCADSFKALGLGKEGPVAASMSSKIVDLDTKELNVSGSEVRKGALGESQLMVMSTNEASTPLPAKKCNSASKNACTGGVGIGETCCFMRSAASLREWAITKAALSGAIKKKSNEK